MTDLETIHAFYGPSSPWAYLGAERLYALADRHACPLILRPIRVIQENGGVPLRTRPKPRQEYHALELARWSHHLGIPLNLKPKYYPCRTIETAAGAIIAIQRAGLDALAFSFAIQRALWAQDRDIADVKTLKELAKENVRKAATLAGITVDEDCFSLVMVFFPLCIRCAIAPAPPPFSTASLGLAFHLA